MVLSLSSQNSCHSYFESPNLIPYFFLKKNLSVFLLFFFFPLSGRFTQLCLPTLLLSF